MIDKDTEPLLKARNLVKHFPLKDGGVVRAVDGVSFNLHRGETLSIVGESGCGKSTLGRTAIWIHEPTAGRLTFAGQDLRTLNKRDMRAMRRRMQFIFQDPYASLDSRRTIGHAITEPLMIHRIGTARQRREKLHELLATVGLDNAAADKYPHEFSGGQRQRIGIARAIAAEPDLIIADEPVSALDVSIQSQILNLLVNLRRQFQLSYIFISHDLAVVKHISDRVAVMYLGKFVERGHVEDVFSNPLHPYTEALLSAIPRLDSRYRANRIILKGDVPDPSAPPRGCHFHPRCPKVMDVCRQEAPVLTEKWSGERSHQVYCHLYKA
jgi:oligopeptide/dipeptide ABC transporter ATP-binding protein